jgi:hypothetical protein
MSGSPAPIHDTFSASARICLAQAFERLGLRHEVLPLVDDLGYGPIEPGTLAQRDAWIDDELGVEADPWRAEKIPAFWERVTSTSQPIVAWMSTRSVSERCGLLALLHRVTHVPVSIVDVADLADAFAHERSDVIVDQKLLERATPVTDAERARHQAEWQRLRAENAPLRVMTGDGIGSAPITHFDEIVLAGVTGEWQTGARVVAAAIAKLAAGPYRQSDTDDLLFARLLVLADDDGAVEGKNDAEFWSMKTSKFRRRPANARST